MINATFMINDILTLTKMVNEPRPKSNFSRKSVDHPTSQLRPLIGLRNQTVRAERSRFTIPAD